MPVVRNPQFYFKEGFCWNLINGTKNTNDLKFRDSNKGVYDVGAMTLHSALKYIPNFFILSICNSNIMSRYTESFINFTLNFQVNDCKLIPIIIPNSEQLKEINNIYNRIIDTKKNNDIINLNSYEIEMSNHIRDLYII